MRDSLPPSTVDDNLQPLSSSDLSIVSVSNPDHNNNDVADLNYDLYLLAIAKLLNDNYLRLFSFYFHTLIQQRFNKDMPWDEHLEELRQRIFYSLIACIIGIIACFVLVKPIVQLLEIPAQGIKFLQLAPGEYFFVSLKVAGYCGLLIASPFILYQIIQFVLPGLTRQERRLVAPVVLGSTILFAVGLVFAYLLLIPAALKFFINYGEGVVEQSWSIESYFEFILLLLFSTGLAFQIPVIQALLGFLGIVSSQKMLSGWRYVILGAAILGAIITPSTDPLTQSLLAGAVLCLYFSGIGLVKLLGR